VIRTHIGLPESHRLAELYRDVTALLDELRPDMVAIERVFVNRNLHTAMGVARASGVILLAAANAGHAVAEYTPTAVKVAVTGFGGAPKRQVQEVVASRLGLAEPPSPPDAADALAVALCHLQTMRGAGGHRTIADRLIG